MEGLAAQIIWEIKYRDGLYLLEDLGEWIALKDWGDFWEDAMLIPVPLHKRRLRSRGYNQAEEICREIGCRLELPMLPGLLHRIRWTTSQTLLRREARLQNVSAAFTLEPGLASEPEFGRRIILVDDVVTTGATIRGCARILRNSGYSRIHAFSVAHG